MNKQQQGIWALLGIQPTADKRAIRHAYARKCRDCHPEDHPEEFRQLHQAYEQALSCADDEGKPLSSMGKTQKRADRSEEYIEADASAKHRDELPPHSSSDTGETTGRAFFRKDPGGLSDPSDTGSAAGQMLSRKDWDELLARGMEESTLFSDGPDPLSWQQPEQIGDPSAAHTESEEEELLEQMKLLEAFSKAHPPQDDCAWQQLMERWDLLADSSLFRRLGEKPCCFQILFDWLNAERGRLDITTVIGLLRIYQIKGRILGHPWKSRRYARRMPELSRLTYEFVFYQSLWDADLFLEKFKLYGERKKPEGGIWQWLTKHRLFE